MDIDIGRSAVGEVSIRPRFSWDLYGERVQGGGRANGLLNHLLGVVGDDPPMQRLVSLFMMGIGVELCLPNPTIGDHLPTSHLAALVKQTQLNELLERVLVMMNNLPTTHNDMVAELRRLDAMISGRVTIEGVNLDFATGQLAFTYRSEDVIALAAIEALLRHAHGGTLKRCACCRCYFFPLKRADQVFCDRRAPDSTAGDGRTCRQVGPYERYLRSPDDAKRTYNRYYQRMAKRKQRELIDETVLNEWRVRARGLVETARAKQWLPQELNNALAAITPDAASAK